MDSKALKYFMSHHQHKGVPIAKALRAAGYKFVYRNADIALFDHAINRNDSKEIREGIKRMHKEGATIIMYPHAATGAWWVDHSFARDSIVSQQLVMSEGQKRVHAIMDPEMQSHVIGWYYCPIKKFARPNAIRRILFAPIHGPDKGELRSECKDANSRIHSALVELSSKYHVVVRHLNSTKKHGFKEHSRITYTLGKPDGSYSQIDQADLVIAEGTFMYMSVARGKPTIGINQHIPIRANSSTEMVTPPNWDKYGEMMAYPIDFDSDDIITLMDRAMDEQIAWRELFIGEQMQPKKLLETVQQIRNSDPRRILC